MPAGHDLQPEVPTIALSYRCLRAVLRIWFGAGFRKIRLLRGDAVPASGAVLLVVSDAASFREALMLVAALERQVSLVLDARLLRAYWRRWLARWLGIIPYESGAKGQRAALQAVREALAQRRAVALFAEPGVKSADITLVGALPASLALETEAEHAGQLGLRVFPVHLFLPGRGSQSGELLIYVNAPLFPRDYLVGGAGDVAARRFAGALEEALQENAFRLQPPDLRHFLTDLEEVLRAKLEEEWAARPRCKQKVEGFTLSQFVAEWLEQMNFLEPGRLVALREQLEAYCEERRRWWLRQFEVEAAGAWLQSWPRRVWYWLESLVGLPIAIYGLVNHLLAWILLCWAGLLKKDDGRPRTVTWLLRGLIVLGCYAGQILLCAHYLGRTAAGYYAPTLPLSGACLWRYQWLLRARTRLLLLAAHLPRQAQKLRRRRDRFVEDLNRARDAYAQRLGIPH